jgi:Secreted trypsin-like serine protease
VRSQAGAGALISSLFTSLTVLLLVTACAQGDGYTDELAHDSAQESSIVGGAVVAPKDALAASTVAIIESDSSPFKQSCTGTLISSNLVLTAAHCVAGLKSTNLYVHFGSVLPKTFSFDKLATVSGIVANEREEMDVDNYPRTELGDIAVLKLSKPAPAGFKPAKINAGRKITLIDDFVVAGFGKISDEEKIPTLNLYSATVPVWKLWRSLIILDQTAGAGACRGDSGGPAYLKIGEEYVVGGITRGAYNNAPNCHMYVEFTNVSFFKDFIIEAAMTLNPNPNLKPDLPKFLE